MAANMTEPGGVPMRDTARLPPVTTTQILFAVFLGYLAVNRYRYWTRTVRVTTPP